MLTKDGTVCSNLLYHIKEKLATYKDNLILNPNLEDINNNQEAIKHSLPHSRDISHNLTLNRDISPSLKDIILLQESQLILVQIINLDQDHLARPAHLDLPELPVNEVKMVCLARTDKAVMPDRVRSEIMEVDKDV